MCTNAFPNYTVIYQLCVYFKSIPWSGPPPPHLENSILSIQHSKRGDGSGPHPFRKFKFQNKITKGMPWTPGPGKYNYPSDPLPPKNYGSI